MSDQDDLPPEYSSIPRELLKHGRGRFKNVILVPQPSDSPNDPLNWPQWKKESILLIVGLSAAVVGAYGPMLSPGFVQVSSNLGITVEILSQATAWLILSIGLSVFITNPLAKIVGRRPVYLVAICIMFATSTWGAAVTTYNSFLASRIVAGIGMAAFEILVIATIGDLYFVHERATRIAVWNLFLLTGISGGALIAGYIIELDGYRWTFGVCAVFFGALMIGVIFFVPETAYRRNPVIPVVETDETGPHLKADHEHAIHEQKEPALGGGDPGGEKKHTYIRSLRIITGRYSDAPAWKIFLRPVVMWFYPAVLWAFLIYGTSYNPPSNHYTYGPRANADSNRDYHHLDSRLFGSERGHIRVTTLQLQC
jgi:MFS family permease